MLFSRCFRLIRCRLCYTSARYIFAVFRIAKSKRFGIESNNIGGKCGEKDLMTVIFSADKQLADKHLEPRTKSKVVCQFPGVFQAREYYYYITCSKTSVFSFYFFGWWLFSSFSSYFFIFVQNLLQAIRATMKNFQIKRLNKMWNSWRLSLIHTNDTEITLTHSQTHTILYSRDTIERIWNWVKRTLHTRLAIVEMLTLLNK